MMARAARMSSDGEQFDAASRLIGRKVERDVALVNLRRITLGTGLAAAAMVGMISMGLAGQAASTRPVPLAPPSPSPALVVVRLPVAVIVRVPVPVSSGSRAAAMSGSRRTSAASASSLPLPPPASSTTVAPRPAPTPTPAPVCTSSPSLCPK